MKTGFLITMLMLASSAQAELEMSHDFWGQEIDRPMLNGKMFDASADSASFVCATYYPNYIYSEIGRTEPYSTGDGGLNTVDTIDTPNGPKFFVKHWAGLDKTPVLTKVRCFVTRK